ncbi:response regulator receiver domain-containing protein [Flavobacterium sp. 9]|uniref:response regulator n=1 Tax=Flavobacterium sp. 9 TaxID=2035198 RepID=UPI000C61BA26|nr:response regulator [Flavobacterium sp. 9]PIF30495.1 response regulator receiver domain-containing protein [Flavobacterium sp. 9]
MAAVNQNSHRYIYIADDDEDDRALFTDAILEVDPFIVLKEAQDGMQLMDMLDTLSDPLPDVIFLDINMPKKGGFDCLEQIRKQDGAIKDVKVIILSTSSDPEDIEKALELGATFYAVKPNRFDTLKIFLEDVLKMNWKISKNKKKFRLI